MKKQYMTKDVVLEEIISRIGNAEKYSTRDARRIYNEIIKNLLMLLNFGFEEDIEKFLLHLNRYCEADSIEAGTRELDYLLESLQKADPYIDLDEVCDIHAMFIADLTGDYMVKIDE